MSNNLFFYVYDLIGTCLVFGTFGFSVGRRADRLERNRDAIQRDAERDDRTGLLNHRAFEQRYRRALDHSIQFREPLSVLLIDLDRLKAINDRWGHTTGSAALVHVARTIADCVRAGDTAARWGGDEFAVLMAGADTAIALRIARAVLDRLQSGPVQLGEWKVPIAVSIGIVSGIASRAEDAFFEKADAALYQAKAAGGNSIAVFAPEGPAGPLGEGGR